MGLLALMELHRELSSMSPENLAFILPEKELKELL